MESMSLKMYLPHILVFLGFFVSIATASLLLHKKVQNFYTAFFIELAQAPIEIQRSLIVGDTVKQDNIIQLLKKIQPINKISVLKSLVGGQTLLHINSSSETGINTWYEATLNRDSLVFIFARTTKNPSSEELNRNLQTYQNAGIKIINLKRISE